MRRIGSLEFEDLSLQGHWNFLLGTHSELVIQLGWSAFSDYCFLVIWVLLDMDEERNMYDLWRACMTWTRLGDLEWSGWQGEEIINLSKATHRNG